MQIRSIFKFAAAYEGFQKVFGFSGARQKAIDAYLSIPDGAKIYDIGCGPGKMVTWLPKNVEYHGFDISPEYIESAKKTYPNRGKFYCREFDDSVVEEFGLADIVTLNGVLHHMTDDIARAVLASATKALKPNGQIFTLDGCYRDGQGWLKKKLLDMDRGEYVRDKNAYEKLLKAHFNRIDTYTRDDLSAMPYSWISMVGHKQ